MDFEDIIDIDNELIEKLDVPLDEMCREIQKSKCPNTLEAFFML